MPTDHARVSFKDVWVPDSAVFGPVDNGLVLARHFVHENRIRQAAIRRRRGAILHQREHRLRQHAQAVRQAAAPQPGDPVAAGRTADRSRDGALADLPHGLGDGPHDRAGDPALSLRQGFACATTAATSSSATRPTGRCRCMADGAIRGTNRSSTSIATIAAIASPKVSDQIQMRNVAGHLFGFIGKNRKP